MNEIGHPEQLFRQFPVRSDVFVREVEGATLLSAGKSRTTLPLTKNFSSSSYFHI